MGLFSKKTLTCERCGKEYDARIAVGAHICDECKKREAQKKENVKGYVEYAVDMRMPSYSEEQLDEIATHRGQVLEKYRMSQGISRSELQGASDNYKKLSDEQAADILNRIANSSVSSTMGAAYTESFFVPTQYEKTIVDAQDVFAVGYMSTYKQEVKGGDVILCAVFTNDPYIPAFPVVYIGKMGLFEIFNSKKGRQGVQALFESICPNLTYPVQELDKLRKQIKSDGSVKGNIDLKAMLDMILSAESETGVFNTKVMQSELMPASADMLDQYGFIQETQINEILKLDKMFNRNYWNKQIKRLTNMELGN